MRKQTKLVAVLSAAALLAIGASMTSFAATGWTEESGEWFFYDKDGSKIDGEWKKSGDKWFWLDSDENGAMAMDKLIEDGDYVYYVDATGAMVSNTWVKVVNEDQDDDNDAEYNYYYMQANGRAYKGSETTALKTIDGKRYAFDSEGKMLYGWVDNASGRITGDDGWSEYNLDARYFGSWDDGAMKTGWQKINVVDDDDNKDYWFYFNSNGKRFANDAADKTLKTKKLNGKTYGFDDRGVMVYEWTVASGSETGSASNWSYFNSPEDGARVTKGWFKVVPASKDTTFGADVEEYFDEEGADNEDNNWYYANGDGTLVAGKIEKIKGKYYAFNAKGKMVSGLAQIEVTGEDGEITVHDGGVDADELDTLMKRGGAGTLYYFGDNADSDGSMKTGAVTVTIDGEVHNFNFSKTGGVEGRGAGVTGKDGTKAIYKYGKKIKADADQKYVVVKASGTISDLGVTVEVMESRDLRIGAVGVGANKDEKVKANTSFGADNYLVNNSGSIIKTKSAAKDGDDWYFYAKDYEIKAYADNKNLKGTSIENLVK